MWSFINVSEATLSVPSWDRVIVATGQEIYDKVGLL